MPAFALFLRMMMKAATPPPMAAMTTTMMMIMNRGEPWSAPLAVRMPVSSWALFQVAVLPDFLPSPETLETLPGKVTLTDTWLSESKPKPYISKVKDLDLLSWVISAEGMLLLNFLIVMPLIVTVQEFPLSPLLTLTLTSSPRLSLRLSASQLELEPASSPFVIMVTSTVSFS